MPDRALLTAHRPVAILGRLEALRPPSLPTAALAIAGVHGAYCLWTGILMAGDSQTYAYWSERLLDSRFAYATLIAEAQSSFPAILYALFATIVALLRLGFGDSWPAALVTFNFASHVGLGVLLVRLAIRVTGSGAGGWTALLLFLACFDLLQWVNFVLSDASFVLLTFTTFTLAASRVLGDSKGWLAVTIPAAAGIFYRPTGMVLIPDLMLAFHLSRRRRSGISTRLLASVAAALGAGLILFLLLMQDSGRWPIRTLSGAIEVIAQGYSAGEVVSARFETYHQPPISLLDHMLILADRLLHFFAVGASAYSPAHWLASAGFLLPCYALGAWLLFALWRGDTEFAAPERKVFITAAGAVLAYAGFHALVQIDFDWRYRTPALPYLILLAAGGATDLVRRRNRR